MAEKFVKHGHLFRKSFTLANKNVAKWFPGHMHKGMQKMVSRIKSVDCVIEVRDARIPLSGQNPRFSGILAARPHVLLLNKADLCDMSFKDDVEHMLKQQGIKELMWINCKEQFPSVIKKDLIPTIMNSINSYERYKQTDLSIYNVMVIGIPNVGKSSLINTIRRVLIQKGKATPVGARAGITRSVLEKIKVSADPKIYVYDTPGVLAPEVKNVDVGMKLALCACLQDHLVGEDVIVDFLLYWFNKHNNFRYVSVFELKEPLDDVLEFLNHVALKNNKIARVTSLDPSQGRTVYKPDFTAAAALVLKKFRAGELGPVMLDSNKMKHLHKA
ncbi:mitochondrial ribosome-associated GTPase 1-like [Octopus vulgaris]|uniref:Mitochondrial GTPase 1 n=3 Tax=Octopus vulgaris TaxID=6645 RepID=A0AA36BTN6_OCTVU|nr:mitochondrial ribosome-associated GTPase 1-like [Octopus vulgaris]